MRRLLLLPSLLALALAGAACSGDSSSPGASPSPAESTTPGTAAASATATATATPESRTPWTIQAAEVLPADVVVAVETGCFQCDGPPQSLQRVGTLGDGASIARELFKAEGPGAYISSLYVGPGGHESWTFVCTKGDCGPVGPPSDDAEQSLFHSDDGGITWSSVAVFGADVSMVSVVSGLPILARVGEDSGGKPATTYFTLEGGRLITAPAGAFPVYQSGGSDLLWQMDENKKLVRTDGSVVFSSERPFLVAGTPHPNANTVLVFWREAEAPFKVTEFALVENGKVVKTYEPGSAEFFVRIGGWIDTRHAYGNAGLRPADVPGARGGTPGRGYSIPVIFNLETGAITPITLFGDLFTGAFDRNTVRAVDRGEAATGFTVPWVVAAEGDCLNVREQPSTSAAVLRCFADGVVVWAKAGEPTVSEGITWGQVLGPDGTEGWASREFLKR